MKEMLTIKLSERDGDGWRLAYVFQISAIDVLTRILVILSSRVSCIEIDFVVSAGNTRPPFIPTKTNLFVADLNFGFQTFVSND